MSLLANVYRQTEKLTGLTEAQIKDYSPEQMRTHLENRSGAKVTFNSEFPVIGRGSVLRKELISSDELNAEIDSLLLQD